MAISEEDLEKMFDRQAKMAAQKVTEQINERLQKWSERSDKKADERFRQWSKESEERMDKRVKELTQESDERMERYIGALKEDFNEKLEVFFEHISVLPKMQEVIANLQENVTGIKDKQDIMLDQIGDMAEDVTIIKESVKNHEVRLQKLETQ